MIKNYFKIAWRNLLKNKFYSVINIAGLTLGLAIGILILLWVQDELSYDNFEKKADNIYRVELFGGTGTSRQIWSAGVAPIAPLAKQELPEVIEDVRITGAGNYGLFKYRDKVFSNENAIYADPSYFKVFDFILIKGDKNKPFADDHSVVITKETALKFFGSVDVIGKVITADEKTPLTVSGVVADFPENTALRCDMILPISSHFANMLANHIDMSDNFSFFSYNNYLLLKPGTNTNDLAKKITQIHLKHKPDDTDADYLLLPLTKMHLYNADMTSNGIETIRIFLGIALLILIIACINYVNLSTARSMLRSKEISMRKIVGAGKGQLFTQFIFETAFLFFLAAVLAIGLIFLLLPLFNQLSAKTLVINIFDYHIWLVVATTIVGTLAASSIYPALLLSSFEPLKALKGKISIGLGDVLFRKALVIIQFSFSILLIIGTIVITRQLNYIRVKDLGYDKSHVFSLSMHKMAMHYDAVKAELLKDPSVLDVSRSNQNIVRYGGLSGDLDWDGKDPKQNLLIHPIVIDKDFVPFFKMKMVDGATFTGEAIDTANYVLNEAAVKKMGIKNPIGKWFRMNKIKGKIIGVVKDFHYSSMKEKIAPSLFWYAPQNLSTMYVKTTGRGAPKAIAAVMQQFKHYNGEFEFGYAFLDEIFNNMYKGEQREGTLFNYFAGIAIFISCLGLLGLAAYTAQVRTREIGVRKVLGASVSTLVGLLARDFIKLVVIAVIIASPLAWFLMNKWLQSFAYRISLTWWIPVSAGLIAVFIALATISFQSVKAAIANPVKSLRSE